ncbi:hypothetical protein C5O80_07390 [Burkholderia sp. SRS-46]|nr:hypothetical protein C5O80_07390 [Burkholderia sp. SRS-46]
MTRWRVVRTSLLLALCLSLAACAGGQQTGPEVPVEVPQKVRLLAGDTKALNYTPWYIHSFALFGPSRSGIGGGGPNVMPIKANGRPSEGGGKCCTSLPAEWQPELKLTVRWLVEKKRADGKKWGYWYKAENVQIAPYSSGNTGDAWAIFLPGDRVRIMLTDGNRDGGNNPNNRPADNDPYIAQGVIDEEWNRRYPPAHD